MTVVNRWAVFTIVGALGFIVQTAALVLLTRAGIHYLPAVAMAVEIAVLHNFLCHERWTWRDRPTTGASERLARLASFNLTNGLGSIVGNLVIVSLLVEALGATVVGAGLIGMLLTGLVNFVASDRMVFGRPRWLRALGLARIRPTALALALATLMGAGIEAAELRSETSCAWARYVEATEARIAREEGALYRLLVDPAAARIMARLRAGEVIIERLETHDRAGGDIDVPGGLIHHWRGAVFLGDVPLDGLLAATRSPDVTARRQPDVLDVKVLERHGETLRLYLKVERRTPFLPEKTLPALVSVAPTAPGCAGCAFTVAHRCTCGSTLSRVQLMLAALAFDSDAPLDLLWREYSQAFKDFDDLTLARWLAPTLGQLEGKVWRLSHPLVGAYRLGAQLGHERQIWLKRLATPPAAYTESACCRAPRCRLLTRDVRESGLICQHCNETLVPYEEIPADIRPELELWAVEYEPVHAVAHWDDRQRRSAGDSNRAYENPAEEAEQLLATRTGRPRPASP